MRKQSTLLRMGDIPGATQQRDRARFLVSPAAHTTLRLGCPRSGATLLGCLTRPSALRHFLSALHRPIPTLALRRFLEIPAGAQSPPMARWPFLATRPAIIIMGLVLKRFLATLLVPITMRSAMGLWPATLPAIETQRWVKVRWLAAQLGRRTQR